MTPVMNETAPETVTDAGFRAAMGRFASGVTVVTTRTPDGDLAATVSAFSSLSNDPPSVLVCLNRSSETCRAIQETGSFTVNVLARSQIDVALRLAGKGRGKLDGIEVERSVHLGHAVLPGNHAVVECGVTQAVPSGTHLVLLADVLSIRLGRRTTPLAYHAGAFGRFAEERGAKGRVVLPDFHSHESDLW
ncbi:flavin reductase family protein [Nocardioides zeae]|uniref:Flavin reductase family protein n=1 Tax=Nocardioides imazamoxiresistens TaxID=3231893 RepID=A0ABU3PVP7_9ACTN|nr:flavin reductase family protein [Nocardioides zeae]MDT9593303.1 flavin reductase family protein [Nocardioides zeae]